MDVSKIILESILYIQISNIFWLIQINKIIFKLSNVFINTHIKNSI